MKYSLYNKEETHSLFEILSEMNPIEYSLYNRNISNPKRYMNLKEEDTCNYSNLNNIDDAVECYMKHFNNMDKIGVIVDTDVDGYTSSAQIILATQRLSMDYHKKEYPIVYLMHIEPKAHGITEDVEIPEDIKLLIVPDAGTNDTNACKKLKEKGIDVIVLDHHKLDEENDENVYAIIVNNQLSDDYENKDFCGAGVVYKFLQALDNENWTEYADDYLDLVALGNISDNMDLKSFETKYYIDKGLNNICNELFKVIIDMQSYSMKDVVNIHNVQFYITPVLNGMIRFGSLNERELLFRAFIEDYEEFEYKKRATKNNSAMTTIEDIYTRAVRLSKNAKARQDKQREKAAKEIGNLLDESPFDDKVNVIDVTDLVDKSLTGVCAIKIAEKYNKPCILLKRFYDKKLKKNVLSGSGRNIDYSPIESFLELVKENGNFLFARGHDSAFGTAIEEDKLTDAINEFNRQLVDIEYDSTYKVDFIIDKNDLSIGIINDLSKFDSYVGNKIDEILIAIENINLLASDIKIIGTKEDTITFSINDVDIIQFKCKQGDQLYDFINNAWDDNDEVTINIVGHPCLTQYQNILKPQVIVKDLEIVNSSLDTNIDENNYDEW